MHRTHSWVKRGTEYIERVPMNWGKTLTLLVAIRQRGWVTADHVCDDQCRPLRRVAHAAALAAPPTWRRLDYGKPGRASQRPCPPGLPRSSRAPALSAAFLSRPQSH